MYRHNTVRCTQKPTRNINERNAADINTASLTTAGWAGLADWAGFYMSNIAHVARICFTNPSCVCGAIKQVVQHFMR